MDARALGSGKEPARIDHYAALDCFFRQFSNGGHQLGFRRQACLGIFCSFHQHHEFHCPASRGLKSGITLVGRIHYFFFLANSAPSFLARSTPSPGSKSSISKNGRTSTTPSWPFPKGSGMRLAQLRASSFDFTSMIQKPAASSFVSGKGPSTIVRFPWENFTRKPFELG